MRRSVAVAVAVVVVVVVLAGCRTDRTSEPERLDPAIAVCEVIDPVWERSQMVRLLDDEGLTFSEFVARDHPSDTSQDAWKSIADVREPISPHGGLALGRDHLGKLGPYEPVVAYIDDRGFAWDPEFKDKVEMPERTEAVVESAERLDRDLASGMCENGPARREVGG